MYKITFVTHPDRQMLEIQGLVNGVVSVPVKDALELSKEIHRVLWDSCDYKSAGYSHKCGDCPNSNCVFKSEGVEKENTTVKLNIEKSMLVTGKHEIDTLYSENSKLKNQLKIAKDMLVTALIEIENLNIN